MEGEPQMFAKCLYLTVKGGNTVVLGLRFNVRYRFLHPRRRDAACKIARTPATEHSGARVLPQPRTGFGFYRRHKIT